MGRWKVKGCPRCGGDMFVDSDEDGWYEKCMLCSHRAELKKTDKFAKPAAESNEIEAATEKPVPRSS